MSKLQPISRRTVLKGLGAAVALPWLEAMAPCSVFAAAERAPAGPPLRLAYLYVPNGIHMQDWTPNSEGALGDLPHLLEPLKGFKDDLLLLSGLTLDKARANGDGGGDHARSMSSFLTGRQARKTHGADIRIGVSADQVVAQKVGEATRFASLEIGCEYGKNDGNCDSGYSCAYSANLAWRTESTPVSKEVDPRLVFERLFADPKETAANRERRDRQRKSILDFVAEDAADLKKKLGGTDGRKLDEYLAGIRDVEQRLTRVEKNPENQFKPDMARPSGVPKEYKEHIRLMGDILALAFQADLTRVGTFVFANEGSNRNYRFIDVPEGHHDLSHHGGDKAKHEKIKKINRFHVEGLAYLLSKLKGIKENAGTLLDSCMVVYGSGIGDGNRHNHDELPILVAGKGNGTLKPGRHVRYRRETPLTNLHLSLLDRMGAKIPSLGDSTGRLTGLDG